MKRIVFAAIILTGVGRAIAKDHTSEQQMLDSAHKPADLFQSKANPFDLEVDFVAKLNGSAKGHLPLNWKSKDQWRSKVEIGGFEQITIQNGEMRHIVRNIGFTPTPIHDLFDLLPFMSSPLRFIAIKSKVRADSGILMECIQAQPEGFKDHTHEVCLDPTSHDLVSDESQTLYDPRNREQFADYSEFNGIEYPRKLQLLKNGGLEISATVISLETVLFDSALLVAPKGAIERRVCPAMKPPVPKDQPIPTYPQGFSSKGTFALTILANGSVGEIHLIGRGDHDIDDATLAALKKWTFKPAMCGAEPVVADFDITVNLNSR
jgi:Gram-negative bacterial TonB protein C-terminal